MILLSKTKGFTLVELTIVLIVMSILISVAISAYDYFVASAKASRLNSYATAMMSGARLANSVNLAKGLSPNDLFATGDGQAAFGWPKAEYVCNLVLEQTGSGPDSTLTPTSTPISCKNGVLTDETVSAKKCVATYNPSTSASSSAWMDKTQVNEQNCK